VSATLIALAIWAATVLGHQEQATLTGRVTSGTATGPVAGAIVRTATASTQADSDGRFTLIVPVSEPLRDGSRVHVTVGAAGFLDVELDVQLESGRAQLEIVLPRNPEYREEIVVSGRTAEVAVKPPTLVLEPLTVSRVAGSADNVFHVLQAMPGVAATEDFGSRLAVRGGGPDQNLTVMDGVEVHNPYRLFGLTSAFNPETIDKFELTAGGFGAKYGDRLSSILVIDNRAGSPTRRVSGSAALSITDANIVLEGGLPSGSWLVTGRRTYYDIVAERLTNNDLPSFGDLQAKGVWEPRPGRRVTLFALRSRENTDARFDNNKSGDTIGLRDASNNDMVSLIYSTALGRHATLRTTGAYYTYRDALDVDGSVRNDAARSNSPDDAAFARSAIVFTRSLGVRDASFRQELTFAAPHGHTFDVGVEAHALRTTWGWTITGDRNPTAPNGSSVFGGTGLPDLLASTADSPRVGIYAEDDVQATKRLRVAGGARFDWSGLAREAIVSPRLRATLDIAPHTKLRAAIGLYTQSPGYEKLLQSNYFVDLSNAAALGLKSERSVHVIGGVEHDVSTSTVARIEGYHKTFDRAMAGRLETPAETAARVGQYAFPAELSASIPTDPQITTVPDNGASGDSYGVDVYLEKRAVSAHDRISGWIAYTWGKARLDEYGYHYPFDYDRRHALSVVSTWRVLPRISLGTTLRIASGFPFTTPLSVRVAPVLAPNAVAGAPGSLVPRRDSNGLYVWEADYGGVANLNRGRLPLYARLDLRVTYMRSTASRWQLYLETINALNRKNAGSLTPKLRYDPMSDRPRVDLTRDGALPLLPTFGFRIRF
jgi:hypothetical protein